MEPLIASLARTENLRGGGVSSLNASRRRVFVALAAVAVALMLALCAVQPAHADGKSNGTWGTSAWSLNQSGDTLTVERDGGGHRAGSVASAPWNPSNPDHADMTKVKTIVIGTAQVPVTFEYGSAENLFADLSGVETIDLTYFDTSLGTNYGGSAIEGATNMAGMFKGCSNLTTLKLGNDFDTSLATSMANMFNGCSKLAALDVSRFNTSRCTSMSGMFSGCQALNSLNVSTFNTSYVTDMSGMFKGCTALGRPNVSGFDTSQVTSMREMFSACTTLTELDVSKFDTSRVTTMALMFNACTSLKDVDVSGFNTSNVTSMDAMFNACKALEFLDVSGFDTSQVTSMGSMFSGCSSLAFLDLSAFDVSNVNDMHSMFSNCGKLVTLDISSFSASDSNMFSNCAALSAVRMGNTFTFSSGAMLPSGGVQNIGGMGISSTTQWLDPKGGAHVPDELRPSVQGAGWYLAQPQTLRSYAFFDWGVRTIPPTFVNTTGGSASDPGKLGGSTPQGWVDAAGNSVTFPVTVADGSASAFSATWGKQPFSIDNYDVSPRVDITYDGKAHGVTVVPKNGFAGAVTKISYVKTDDNTVSTASPKDAGTYEVLIDVAENASFAGATDYSLGTFTINKITLADQPGNALKVLLPNIYEGTTETTNTPIKITGGNVVPTEDPLNATAATVTYPRGNEFGVTSAEDATVSGIQIENPNYEPLASISNQSYNVLTKDYPDLADFTISLPGDSTTHEVVYNSQPQQAAIKPAQGIEGMGAVTVKYSKNGGPAETKVPKDVGTYEVTFDVANGVAFWGVNGLKAGTFTITPLKLNSSIKANLPFVFVGSPTGSYENVDITLENEKGGNIPTSEAPLTATATVEYPKTDTVVDRVEEAIVSNVKLVPANENYKIPSDYILKFQAYEVRRKTPTAGDFQNDMPPNAIDYDGKSRPVTVTANDPAMGAVTVFYAKDKGDPETVAPKDAGEYEVTFKVEQSDVYEAGSFSLGTLVIKPIALDTTVTAVLPDVYEGVGTVAKTPITLTGGPIVEASLDANATVTHPSSGKGANSYQDATVSAIELTSPNYTASGLVLENQPYTVLAKGTPEPSNFTIGLPTGPIDYDGQDHPVSVEAKDPVNMGAVTVKYSKNGGAATTVAPKDAGTYQVLIDVADGVSFWGAQDLDGGTFTIAKRVLNGQEKTSVLNTIRDAKSAQNVSVVLSGGAIVTGEQVPATASEVEFPSADVLKPHDDAEVTLAPLPDEANYVLPGNGLTLTGQSYTVSEKPTPSVGQFVVTPVTAEYDGREHGASVAPGAGVGAVENLRYLKGGTPVVGAPVDAGTYAVMFDVKEGTGYAAAKDLVAQDAVTITPRVLDGESVAQLAEVPQRTLEASNVAVTLSGGRILSGEVRATASKASYPSAAAVGTFRDATVELALLVDAPNYALPSDGLVLTGQAYTVAPEPYRFLEGENGSWKQGSGEGLSVRVEADIDKYRATFVDGERVGDDNLAVTEGSTIVTLKPAYLATLAPGAHTLRVEFEDGIAETAFTVAKAPGPGSDTTNGGAGTGGSGTSALAPAGDPVAPFAVAVAALAVLALAGLAAFRRAGR